jgi:hypothetical protein
MEEQNNTNPEEEKNENPQEGTAGGVDPIQPVTPPTGASYAQEASQMFSSD